MGKYTNSEEGNEHPIILKFQYCGSSEGDDACRSSDSGGDKVIVALVRWKWHASGGHCDSNCVVVVAGVSVGCDSLVMHFLCQHNKNGLGGSHSRVDNGVHIFCSVLKL